MKYLDTKGKSLEDSVTRVLKGLSEKIEYAEYKFKNKNDAMKAKKMLDAIQLMDFDINDDNISGGELMVDAGNKDMTKYHQEIIKKFRPKVMATETNKNNKSDDGEGLDAVQPDAVKKKFKDRKDKDIDNDGDVDSSDKFLHKKRKAISKAMKKEDMFDEGKKLKSSVDVDFELYSDPKKKAANMAMNNEIRRAQMMKDYKTAREYMNKVQKKYSKLGAEDSEADRTIDKILGVVFGKVNMGGDKKMFEKVEIDENYRKLAMKGIGTETKKGARVGLKTDYYLPSNGDKSFGKIMRVSKDGYEIQDEKTKKTYKFKFYDSKNRPRGYASDAERRSEYGENYDIGNDYAKHTLEVTPGQDKSDVDEMLGIMQKKSASMREALAKVWGVDEGKSPFQKEEEKIKEKTLTGKKPTEVKVDPEIEVK